jgi:preprotein translocase subunit SecY
MVTDVTDATAERARAPISYPVRAAVTLLLLAAYVFGRRLALPDVDRDGLLEMRMGLDLSGILMLGLNPLISGFLLVELFSLMTSPGRRLRRLGTAGRATLNRAALITSLLLAAVQAAGNTLTLERMSSPSGLPIVANPGLGFKLVTVTTLTAATAALFALGQAISAYGIGNGFALLILTRGALSIWTGGRASLRTISDSSSWQGIILLLVVGVACSSPVSSAPPRTRGCRPSRRGSCRRRWRSPSSR